MSGTMIFIIVMKKLLRLKLLPPNRSGQLWREVIAHYRQAVVVVAQAAGLRNLADCSHQQFAKDGQQALAEYRASPANRKMRSTRTPTS